jgi:5-(carboxyamino)imidazole ribonucleotide synthase
MYKNFNSIKIGMLGGGQLGRMLLQKAADFSLYFKVLDPDPAAPCRHLADEFVNGSFNDFDTVYSFGKTCDLITIEIEHVNVEALEKLQSEGVTVYPQPSVIRLVQDKGEQKLFYKKYNFPTASFQLINSREDLKKINPVLPIIQKVRKGGYDGKGVLKISNASEFDTAFNDPSIIEELVPFKKEIAVIVARGPEGSVKCFPAVDMEFNSEANLVEYLLSPAELSEDLAKKAMQIATDLADAFKIVGVLAVEMFLTKNDELLINEIAPRPHNSGHHTIESNVTSQYEQHLRAILGMPLGNTDVIKPAVMVNLIGEKNYDGPVIYKSMNEILEMEEVHIHLYGKKFTRPFRKMGHVTITGNTIDEAKEKAVQVKKILKVISE